MSEQLNLIDENERQRIEEDLEKNFLVEAGAGSGKTTSLVDRFVALVISDKYEPGEIAAITFTRRAAAELKEKIQLKLEEKAASCDNRKKKQVLRKALDNMDSYFLGTIHSFCARLLKERPVEFNIDPRFEQLDELSARQEREHAWQNYLVRARVQKEELMEDLMSTDLNPIQLKPAFKLLDNFPEVQVAAEEVEKPDLSSPVNSVLNFVEEAITIIPREEPEKGYDKLQSAVRQAWGYNKYTDLKRDVNKFRLLKSFAGSLKVTLKRWQDKDKAKEYRDERAPILQENVVEPVLRRWYRYRHERAVKFIKPAVDEHRQLRREEAELNFQDLLHITARGLRENPDLRHYFQQKYKSLLVDEFQDTDPLQAEIIFYLTGRKLEEKSWQKLTPHSGSLFLVGDPKQSIYRFRRADIDIYNLVRDRLQSGAGEVLNLTSNFRSLPAVTEPLNEVFKEILPAEESSYQASFAPLNPVRKGQKEALSGVKVLEIPEEYTRKKEIVKEDARRIAAIIEDAVRGERKLAYSQPEIKDVKLENPKYEDFMIILRYKDLMEEYVKALKKYDIPTDVSGGSTLDRSTVEIRELHKLVKFLQDNNNPVLLTAVLRGLFYGLSDDELYQYHSAGGELILKAEIPGELEKETAEKFEAVFNQLKKFCRMVEEMPPAMALEKMVEELGLIPHLLTEESGENKLSSIYYLLELLKAAEAGRGIDFAGLVDEFDTVLEAEVEEELNLSYGSDAVRIMNLHKSKGLEAPVVFLAHPKKYISRTPERHIKREKGKPVGYFRFCQEDSYGNKKTMTLPPEWEKREKEEEKYKGAEEERLLYVAATRARNLLVISDCSSGKNSWQPLLDNLHQLEEIKMPELKTKEDKSTEKKEQKETIGKEKILALKENLGKWKGKAVTPTYGITSVTELAGEGYSEETDQTEEKVRTKEEAVTFGTAAHNLVEKVIGKRRGPEDVNLEKLAKMAAGESGMEESQTEQLEKLMEVGHNILSSELWNRLSKSEVVKTEVPFLLKTEPGEMLYTKIAEGELDAVDSDLKTESKVNKVYIAGRIDLAFREKKDWTIVDFKTGHQPREEHEAENKYENQLETYRLVWESLTAEKAGETMIYWLDAE